MTRRWSTGIVAVVALTVGLSSAALAAATGTYKGTTSEKGTVTFTVTAHAVTHFVTTDGYNGQCHFQGGAGGFPFWKISIASMPLTASGHFSTRVTLSNKPISGTSVIAISGHFVGNRAVGTINAVGLTCGSFASNPTAPIDLESFSATRG